MEIKEFFDDHDIRYWEDGKNVGRGWINIQCPFCDDTSNHMGIRLKDLYVSCWRCGHHNLFDLIKELTGLNNYETNNIKKALSPEEGSNPPLEQSTSPILNLRATLPLESTTSFSKKHIAYLKKRGFTPPESFIEKYKLRAVHEIGDYKFRIVIPVYMNRKLVSFSTRDITDLQDPKYLSNSLIEGMNIKHAVYNYDKIIPNSDIILVEGPLDVWKFGVGSCSLFGVSCTSKQIIALKNKRIRNLFILFDNDLTGERGAEKISSMLLPIVKKIEIISLTEVNDPGELSLEEAEIIKYKLGIK